MSCCLSQSEGTSSHGISYNCCIFCLSTCHSHFCLVLLSVWRPSEELVELLAENKRFRIFNLTASQ